MIAGLVCALSHAVFAGVLLKLPNKLFAILNLVSSLLATLLIAVSWAYWWREVFSGDSCEDCDYWVGFPLAVTSSVSMRIACLDPRVHAACVLLAARSVAGSHVVRCCVGRRLRSSALSFRSFSSSRSRRATAWESRRSPQKGRRINQSRRPPPRLLERPACLYPFPFLSSTAARLRRTSCCRDEPGE